MHIELTELKPHKNIPPEVYMYLLTILLTAYGGRPEAENVEKAAKRLDRLCEKHLSDSPDQTDRVRLNIDLFELALAIAKGQQL
jgi:hypothetical protein